MPDGFPCRGNRENNFYKANTHHHYEHTMNKDVDKQKENKKRGRWKPGESGNVNGRPRKENCITSLLKAALETIPDGDTRTNAEIITDILIKYARAGEPWSIKEIMDRTEGRASQRVELAGDSEAPLQLVVDLTGFNTDDDTDTTDEPTDDSVQT